MKRRRFSEEQIIGVLKEPEAGLATAQFCRRPGISPATFYKWKSKFGGLELSEAKRLRTLEDENAKLKKLLAEAVLDIAVLKDITGKSSGARRELAGERRHSATGVWVIFWRARASRRTTRSCCVSTARKACLCAAVVAANGRWARARR